MLFVAEEVTVIPVIELPDVPAAISTRKFQPKLGSAHKLLKVADNRGMVDLNFSGS